MYSASYSKTAEDSQKIYMYCLDGIRYDSSRRVAFVGDTIVTLSATENTILTYLLDHPNTVMSRKALLKLIWNDTYDYPTRVIDIHISHLRKSST